MSDDRTFPPDEPLTDNDAGEDFAALLEQSMAGMTLLKPGQKVTATILQISDEWLFLDVGQKGEGVLECKELLDDEGQLTVQVGDRLSVYFLSGRQGELRFTTRLGGGSAGTAQLEEAWRSQIPVEGRIDKEVKGGFEVRLPGNVRAFCPFSQLGLRRQEGETDVAGISLSFRIVQFSEQGRNIVVSHRDIVEEERRQQRATLQESLKEGMIVRGTVTSLRDFGAFIDIGGIEGLLPISEISYGRVENIGEVLQVGQQLEVAVKRLDWENNRFSFSLRDTQADPWSKVGSIYQVGASYRGTVSRLTKFGAFVTLEDGIDGLLHISKIGGGQRIKHPQDILSPGQTIEVTIEKIDMEEKRIALIPATDKATEPTESSFEETPAGGLGTFAELFRKAQRDK
ncbi:MAG: 30S ribosomal protein S1 [Desulfuromonadales bacterium]|nr:30S ribosomal protein S1 [Desulfuromonadales bacterium]